MLIHVLDFLLTAQHRFIMDTLLFSKPAPDEQKSQNCPPYYTRSAKEDLAADWCELLELMKVASWHVDTGVRMNSYLIYKVEKPASHWKRQ